jgi:hypothetical protein
MAGCNTRMMYDQQAFKEKVEESKKPGSYWLYNKQNENASVCFAVNGPRSTRFHASNEIPQFKKEDRVEIESLLTGRSFKNAKYMQGRTVDSRNKSLNKFKGKVNKNCSNIMNHTSTRLNDPSIDLRSKDVTKYHMDYPIINPKEWTFYGFNQNEKDTLRFGRNTQLDARDNYKYKKEVPEDQSNEVSKK